MSYERRRPVIKRVRLDFNSADAAGNTLVDAVADHRIRVLSLRLMAVADVAVSLYSGPADMGTEIDPPAPLAARGGYVLPCPSTPDAFWFQTKKGEALTALLGTAVRCTGVLLYFETTED